MLSVLDSGRLYALEDAFIQRLSEALPLDDSDVVWGPETEIPRDSRRRCLIPTPSRSAITVGTLDVGTARPEKITSCFHFLEPPRGRSEPDDLLETEAGRALKVSHPVTSKS